MYEGRYLGKRAVVKQRFSKSYRLPELDRRLTKERMREEARTMARLLKMHIVDVPCIYHVDAPACTLVMELIDGRTLKDFIHDELEKLSINESARTEWHQWIADQVGSSIAKMHDANIIHGDLTTSNIMIRQKATTCDITSPENVSLCLIDFGLSQSSTLAEDRAVDLYVLERAFHSTHPSQNQLFDEIIQQYFKHTVRSKATSNKFEEVRMRGRKRDMTG